MAGSLAKQEQQVNAFQLARNFAKGVQEELSLSDELARRMINVRNKRDTMDTDSAGAEASITCESGTEIMVEMTLRSDWIEYARQYGFYFEPYASWQVAVFKI